MPMVGMFVCGILFTPKIINVLIIYSLSSDLKLLFFLFEHKQDILMNVVEKLTYILWTKITMDVIAHPPAKLQCWGELSLEFNTVTFQKISLF